MSDIPKNDSTMYTWGLLLDQGAACDSKAAAKVVDAARKAAELEVLRRVYRYEDIGKHRSSEPFPEICKKLDPETRQIFALAMSDHLAGSQISQELPLIAAGCRLSGDGALGRRAIEQLQEMATWSPLQRPGWSQYVPGRHLPPDGKDGNWLATGTCVRTIANTLEIMPAGLVSAELTASLYAVLEKEIVDIVDDWRTKRSWFIKGDNAITNQWVLPTEGLIRACLVTGVDKHRAAYELGVANLLKALNAHGKGGEFEEGIHYAQFTLTSLLHAARAMAVAGDRRALDHPFLRSFATWAAHHIQPGRFLINCFDAYGSRVARRCSGQDVHGGFERMWALLAVSTDSPVAKWVLQDQFDSPPDDDIGLACRAAVKASGYGGGEAVSAPPLFAAYERATRVNWRSSWGDDATGLWVRGGHKTDQHDHIDRGHVNFIVRGQPVFIEAGTAYYDHPRFVQFFKSGCGHNVMQLGLVLPDQAKTECEAGWQKRGVVAPISVERLDAAGGRIAVDCSQCYGGLASWRREVAWSANEPAELVVTDHVELAKDRPDYVLFRWHLGTAERVTVARDGEQFIVRLPAAGITLTASRPVAVDVAMYPDFTLKDRPWADRSPDDLHSCLIVRTTDKVNSLELTTRVV